MPSLPIGNLAELTPDDKVPGIYLKSTSEVGASEGVHYLLVCGTKGSAGAITVDTQVVEILSDADALYWAGANSEGYCMLLRALSVGGVKIKYCAPTLTSTPTAATGTITIAGTWTTTGELYYRIGGRVVGPLSISTTDTVTTIAAALAALINAQSYYRVTATSSSGVVTLTAGNAGARGNNIIVFQDMTLAPAGLTSTIAGGTAVTSGAVPLSTGSGTESVANVLTATFADEYFTNAIAQRDSTNLGLWETQINTKLGPLEGRLENVVCGSPGTISAAGSLAQTTLNNSSFEMLWQEECETPIEEQVALHAAQRHQLEIQHPNNRYDRMLMPGVVPQEAVSKRPSRATQVAALNYGLTPIETRNNASYCVRAVTTRTQTDGGDADNGTVDVAQWRVALEFRRRLAAMLTVHMTNHPYIVDNPADGDEPEVPEGTTYPKLIATDTSTLEYQLENDNWLAQVAANPPRCALHPTSATPRPVLYAPIIPKPLLHQIAGTVALRKFLVAVSA